MFAKIGGKQWKGANVAKTLSDSMTLMGYGLNSKLSYGSKDDKPAWWPKRPKWKNFRSPSKVSKEECTSLIRLLLQHHGVDPDIHYVGYPEEEEESSSDDSDDSDHDDDNVESMQNVNPEDAGRLDDLEEEYEQYQAREVQSSKKQKRRHNYVERMSQQNM